MARASPGRTNVSGLRNLMSGLRNPQSTILPTTS